MSEFSPSDRAPQKTDPAEPGQREHTKPQNAMKTIPLGFIYYNSVIIRMLNESSDRISFMVQYPRTSE